MHTIYPRVQNQETRNNNNDPLYELLTCVSQATCTRHSFFLRGLQRDKEFFFLSLSFFLMAVIWLHCDRRCGARRAVRRSRRAIRGHAVHGNYGARYSPVRNRSASDSRQLKPDSFSAIVWVCGEVEAAILPPYAPLS